MQRTRISPTEEERALLDAETARTGRSMSALIRDAVTKTYGQGVDAERRARDLAAAEAAAGSWTDRDVDGEEYVGRLRTGARWADVLDRCHDRPACPATAELLGARLLTRNVRRVPMFEGLVPPY